MDKLNEILKDCVMLITDRDISEYSDDWPVRMPKSNLKLIREYIERRRKLVCKIIDNVKDLQKEVKND